MAKRKLAGLPVGDDEVERACRVLDMAEGFGVGIEEAYDFGILEEAGMMGDEMESYAFDAGYLKCRADGEGISATELLHRLAPQCRRRKFRLV